MSLAVSNRRDVEWPRWDGFSFSQFQYDVLTDPSKRILINAGRYAGKDWIIQWLFWLKLMVLYVQRLEDPTWSRLGPRVIGFFVVPVSSTFDELWGRLKDTAPPIPGIAPNGNKNVEVWEGKGRWKIELFGGDLVVRCYSAFDADAMRGLGCDVMAISETAYLEENDWVAVLSQIVIRPGFAGIVMMNSTPRNNWWDRAIDDALKKVGYWGRWSVHTANSFSNPRLDQDQVDEIMAIREKNIYQYRREYMAELFVDVPDAAMLGDGVTAAFAPTLIDEALVMENFVPQSPIYVVGIDLAMSDKSKDRLAIVVVEKRSGLIAHVETHDSVENIERLMEIIGLVHERFKPQRMIYDAQGRLGCRVEGRLTRWRAEPFKVTNYQKYEFITRLEQHLVARSLKIPHPELWRFASNVDRQAYQLLLREMRAYCRLDYRDDQVKNHKIHKSMMTTFHKPPGGSDDVLEALVFAMHGIDVPKGEKTNQASKAGRSVLSF